jgi:hypothetical protein
MNGHSRFLLLGPSRPVIVAGWEDLSRSPDPSKPDGINVQYEVNHGNFSQEIQRHRSCRPRWYAIAQGSEVERCVWHCQSHTVRLSDKHFPGVRPQESAVARALVSNFLAKVEIASNFVAGIPATRGQYAPRSLNVVDIGTHRPKRTWRVALSTVAQK